jgi:hypothetical protein
MEKGKLRMKYVMLVLIVMMVASPFYIISAVYAQFTLTGTITGYVKNQDGVGISGASIVVSNYAGAGTVAETSTTSNNSGAFTFQNVPDGTYQLTAYATGYYNGNATATVLMGTSIADITLDAISTPNSNSNSNSPVSKSGYNIAEIVGIAVLVVIIILLCAYLVSTRQKIRALEGRLEDQIEKHEDASKKQTLAEPKKV